MAVDVVDGAPQRRGVEQRAPDAVGVALQPLVGAEARAGGAAELAADLLLLGGDVPGGLADQGVVGLVPRQGRRAGRTFGGAQNLEPALGDAPAVAVHPDQGVVPLRGAQVDERARRTPRRLVVGPGGIHHRRQVLYRLRERRVRRGGVPPDLPGVRGEVDVRLVAAVENACLLVVQVEYRLLVLVLEERLVGPDHLGVLAEARPHAGAEPEQALDPLGRQERITQDVARPLADAVHAAGALDQADDRPRQVVVHHDGAVLQVLALAEHVGGHQHAQLVVRRDAVFPAVASRAETPREARGVFRVPRGRPHPRHAARPKLPFQIAHRVGELGEDQNLPFGVLLHEQLFQGAELGVVRRPPRAEPDEELDQRRRVGRQVPAEGGVEMAGGEPAEPTLVSVAEARVNPRGPRAKIFRGPGRRGPGRRGRRRRRGFFGPLPVRVEQAAGRLGPGRRGFFGLLPVRVEQAAGRCLRVFIGKLRVEQTRVRRSDGERQPVFDGVQEHEVPQHVAFDREQEGVAAALQALEQVGAAEPHQAPAGARQVVQHPGFGRRRRRAGRRRHVVAEAVARKLQAVDGVDHVVGEQPGVLRVDGEAERAGRPRREVRAPAVFEGQVAAAGSAAA